MPHQFRRTGLTESEVDLYIERQESRGATCTKERQADGTYNVLVSYPDPPAQS